jgi:hypothetical protein
MALHNRKSRDFNRFLAHRHIPGTNQEDENASIFIAHPSRCGDFLPAFSRPVRFLSCVATPQGC